MHHRFARLAAAASFALGASALCPHAANAIDFEANDFVDAPPGTNTVLGYYQFQTSSHYNSTVSGTTTKDTNLNQNTGIFRYVYYNQVFNIPYAAQFLIPFAGLTGGEIGGDRLNDTFGAADPILSVGFWPYVNVANKQYVALFSYTSVPLGSYSSTAPLSIGTNRTSEDLLIDYTEGWGHHISTDISADYIFYGDNNNVGTSGQTLKQKSSYQATFWLNYDFTPTSFAAVGWLGTFGGAQTIDGIPNGNKTEFQQIRAEYAFRPTPTIQLLAKVYRDINVVGGFRHDVGVEFRIVKAF